MKLNDNVHFLNYFLSEDINDIDNALMKIPVTSVHNFKYGCLKTYLTNYVTAKTLALNP